jgi:hypothetical protein
VVRVCGLAMNEGALELKTWMTEKELKRRILELFCGTFPGTLRIAARRPKGSETRYIWFYRNRRCRHG